MTRSVLALLLVGCGVPPRPVTDIETVPTNAVAPSAPKEIGQGFRRGHGGFPIPDDADEGQDGAGGSYMYAIRRPRDEVHDQLVAHLRADGWSIKYIGSDGASKVDDKTVFFNGYRMYLKKDDRYHFVSVTRIELDGGAEVTALSITLEPQEPSPF